MTMKPKAKKFRIKRGPGESGGLEAPEQPPQTAAPPAQQQGAVRTGPITSQQMRPQQQHQPRPATQQAPPQAPQQAPAMAGSVQSRAVADGNHSIEAIRREGLTGRQLRMARRVAQKQGLTPSSDFEAVKMLREQGIDPFVRTNLLELVDLETGNTPPRVASGQALAKIDPAKLPQTVTEQPDQQPAKKSAAERRAEEVMKIQRDIARRRRRKFALLGARLSVFVGIPTLILGFYFYALATPLYSTKTNFLIQQSDGGAAAGGGGGMLGGALGSNPLATMQDSVSVQLYLQSPEAMLRLDSTHGYREHFSNENIDVVRRLVPGATNEAMYALYKKMVKIGYDPTEGIVRMEIIAATPEASLAFSQALLSYAEEQVDQLTQRMREDQMRGALDAYQDAEDRRSTALQSLVTIQTELQLVNPEAETSNLQGQVAGLETQIVEKQLQLQALLDNSRPNQARVDGTRADIRRLEAAATEIRSRLTSTTGNGSSQAAKNAQLRAAEEDYETRNIMLQSAAQQVESARLQAESQVRFLSAPVRPTLPQEPAYPRAFENTIVSFFVFAGIYLMLSLTFAVLREQVAS